MPFFISFSAFRLFFIVSLSLYFTGVAAQRGCRNSEIPKLQNAEIPSALKDQYIDTESVRFACNTGFVGFFRVTCRNGVWRMSGECQAKPCGHPGDTLNGDFTLTIGDDFVFGSTVQYTCRKGYTMVSRISHRTCLLSGWDNIVPFCEVVKCEPLNPPEQLDVSGNFEAPQYSDVVEFECNSPALKLNGPKQIYCTDTGDWSGQIPTCQEITCTRPEIPNSIPDSKNIVYKKDDIIRFQCVENYIAEGSGIARCDEYGWTKSLRCEEFTCKVPYGLFLDFTSFHATKYKVGEMVIYSCTEGYKKTQLFATCTLNNWRPLIMCEEIICKKIPNSYCGRRIDAGWCLNYWPYRITHGQYNYECNQGFRKTQHTANCTADGWSPENPCEEITCIKPPNVILLDGGNVVHQGKHGYSCEDGYRQTSREVKCTENGLVSADLCERKCDMPSLTNGYVVRTKDESAISYACDKNYKPKTEGWWDYITCTNGEWSDIPQCIGKCHMPSLRNGYVVHTKDESAISYACDKDYKPKTEGWWDYITCTNEEWSDTPQCIANNSCRALPVTYNTTTHKDEYSDGAKVEIQCYLGKISKCNDVKLECTENCTRFNNERKGSMDEDGGTCEFECQTDYSATCRDGEWTFPPCSDKVKDSPCVMVQDRQLENEDLKKPSQK